MTKFQNSKQLSPAPAKPVHDFEYMNSENNFIDNGKFGAESNLGHFAFGRLG
jgi:hypothetical protein